MTDDGIREHHGMACRKEHEKHSSVAIWEGEQYIWIDHDSMDDRRLTPGAGSLSCAQIVSTCTSH